MNYSLQAHLAADVEAQVNAGKLSEHQEEQLRRAKKVEEMQKLEALLALPHVQELQRYYASVVQREHDAALNPKSPDDQANKYRQRYAIAKEMCDYLPNKLRDLKNELEKVIDS